MPDLGQSSTIESDPLHTYSGLSLFPRTLKSMSIPLPPLYQSDDLQQTHTLLETMPLEIQKEHQEQAKAILDESSELLKQGIGTSVASQDTNVGVKMNPVLNKRERRPALERKRGHFTFKPLISQPPQNEPSFDPSLYPKPGEYFAAYERFLIAQREWQKQTGTLVTETYLYQPSRRPRRPELPGRRRGSYKHTYTDSFFTDLKASEKENPIPSEQSLERNTAAPVKTADREVDESTADTEKKNLENILTELLACSPDELEGDAGVKLLEKRLHIKPVDKEMLSLPDFPEFSDVRRIDLKAPKPRTALANIQNLLKGINSDATRKNSQASASNPPEDQFSFPDRHHLLPGDRQSREVDIAKDSNVCFRSSVANDADKVISNASPSNVDTVHVASDFNSSVQKSSCEGGSDSHSGIHRSHPSPERNADNCVNDNITNINSATLEVNVDMQTKGNEGDVPMSESEANRNTGRRENDADTNEETEELENLAEYASREDSRMDLFTVEEESIPDQQDESSKSPNKPQEQYNTMDGSTEHEEHIQGQHGEENDNTDTAHGPQVEEERIPDQQDESSKSPNKTQEQYNTMDGSTEHEEHIQGQHREENDNTDTAHEPQVESAQQEAAHNSPPKQTNKRRKRGSYYGNMRKRSKTVHGESERDKQTTTSSHESGAKKETKRKPNERKETKQTKTFTRESKMFSRRNSLGGAGTKWEDGVRRSTRIKSRPLEHWRGERFLYGRIHESMNTVIGIKYESPGEKGKGETRALKVKSFVSDDYKELVDSVAMYY